MFSVDTSVVAVVAVVAASVRAGGTAGATLTCSEEVDSLASAVVGPKTKNQPTKNIIHSRRLNLIFARVTESNTPVSPKIARVFEDVATSLRLKRAIY